MSDSSGDTLGLRLSRDFQAMLLQTRGVLKDYFGCIDAAAMGLEERVMFSDELTKINRKGKRQPRVLVITSIALYNFKKGKYSKYLRRMLIPELEAVYRVAKTNHFILRFKAWSRGYDYHYDAGSVLKSKKILDILTRQYENLTGEELKVDSVETALEERVLKKAVRKSERSKEEEKERQEWWSTVEQHFARGGGRGSSSGKGRGRGDEDEDDDPAVSARAATFEASLPIDSPMEGNLFTIHEDESAEDLQEDEDEDDSDEDEDN